MNVITHPQQMMAFVNPYYMSMIFGNIHLNLTNRLVCLHKFKLRISISMIYIHKLL